MSPEIDSAKVAHFTLVPNPNSSRPVEPSPQDLAALAAAEVELTRRCYRLGMSRQQELTLSQLAARISDHFWIVGHGVTISSRKYSQEFSLPGVNARWVHVPTTHILFTVAQERFSPMFIRPLAEFLKLHRYAPPPSPRAIHDWISRGSGVPTETVGGVLCGLFERTHLDKFPAAIGEEALWALRSAMSYHLVTDTIRADALTFVGFLSAQLALGDTTLRACVQSWPPGLLAHTFHLGFAQKIEGNKFMPLGSRHWATVGDKIARLGHQKSRGPFVILATRTIHDHGDAGFSRAFAIPIVATDCVLPSESGNEQMIEAAAKRVITEAAWRTDGCWLRKRLFGRGRLSVGQFVALDDPDRVDLDIGIRTVTIEEETMGYVDVGYRFPKLQMLVDRARTRPIVLVDMSEANTEAAQTAIVREFEYVLRRLFVEVRRHGALTPGIHAVIPRTSWFAAKLAEMEDAPVALPQPIHRSAITGFGSVV